MNPNDRWAKSFQDWRNGKTSISSLQKQLKHFKRIGIDLNLIKTDLASLHDYLDFHLLNPRCHIPRSAELQPRGGTISLCTYVAHGWFWNIVGPVAMATGNGQISTDLALAHCYHDGH